MSWAWDWSLEPGPKEKWGVEFRSQVIGFRKPLELGILVTGCNV